MRVTCVHFQSIISNAQRYFADELGPAVAAACNSGQVLPRPWTESEKECEAVTAWGILLEVLGGGEEGEGGAAGSAGSQGALGRFLCVPVAISNYLNDLHSARATDAARYKHWELNVPKVLRAHPYPYRWKSWITEALQVSRALLTDDMDEAHVIYVDMHCLDLW